MVLAQVSWLAQSQTFSSSHSPDVVQFHKLLENSTGSSPVFKLGYSLDRAQFRAGFFTFLNVSKLTVPNDDGFMEEVP